MLHPNDIQGAELCFLLDVDWLGKIYRFSTVPIDITDTNTGELYRYNGGLGNPTIDQQTSFVGFDIDGNSIAMELTFNDVNWIAEWLQGRSLELAAAAVSMIVVDESNHTVFKYEDRVPLFLGKVKDPIIGTPTRPLGHIIFSIENSTNVKAIKMLDNSFEIDPYVFPGLDQRAATLGRMIETPIGQYVPFVFGALGEWYIRRSGSGRFQILKDQNSARCSPAYIIDATGSGGTLRIELIIAMGTVTAPRIRIWDQDGGNFVNYVYTATNADGTQYSYTWYELGHVIEDNTFVPGLDEDQTFWVAWAEYGEGIQDPLTGQSLGPAGNLCLYCLDQTGLEYDKAAWVGLVTVLNRYKFAGYINDPSILVLDWFKQNIVANLPIEVFNGPNGLTPRLNLYFTQDTIPANHYILESGMFEIQTGLQPLEVQPFNKVTVKYGFTGRLEHYLSTVIIDPTFNGNDNAFIQRDPVSDISYSRFGLLETVIELPFVWEMHTAYRIARDRIRMSGLGAYGIEVSAFPQFGFLEVGEIIALTTEKFGLVEHKCQIVGKSWNSGKWNFVLQLEDNTLVNHRTVS
tara:strand:- start:6221 stop:7942 length:1722 start_codon:yes stop_codon:yes gene_type:complete